MGKYEDFFKGRNRDSKPEYYEDTHNEHGEYVGQQQKKTADKDFVYSQTPINKPEPAARPLPKESDYVSARNYQNVVVYEPKNPDDVQTLIDYLKRREPAIVNLDCVEPDDGQRILDFVSGAIYALNGSVHRVANNIFLLSPEGVEITIPYDQK